MECKMLFYVSCSEKQTTIQSKTHKDAALKYVTENKDYGQIICVSDQEITYNNSDSQVFFLADALKQSQNSKNITENFRVVY